ncbi:MAG: hypothetical protein ABEI57_08165 [Halapricum sp.]
MDCSRCGGKLETYSLGESDAFVCLDCGFVNTPVEHGQVSRPEPEAWNDAIQRFYREHAERIANEAEADETAAEQDADDAEERSEEQPEEREKPA